MNIVALLALLVIHCVNAKAIGDEVVPAIAMFCGKGTQHRDLATGEWISDTIDCVKSDSQLLEYCRKTYPDWTFTGLDRDVLPKVHILHWCSAGTSPPCKGHGHNVVPVKCVGSKKKPEMPALEVPIDCSFQHTYNLTNCQTTEQWDVAAMKICVKKGMVKTKEQMLLHCADDGSYRGIQFICCPAPHLSTPKPNKHKPVPLTKLQPAIVDTENLDVNPLCLEPKFVGYCRALLPAWYYEKRTGKCTFFNYGGCGGNSNNFQSEEKCQDVCLSHKRAKPKFDANVCTMPKVTGPCRAYFLKWYFDTSSGSCRQFVYGGCNGNGNQFQLKEDCEANCRDRVAVDPPNFLPLFQPGPVLLNGKLEPIQSDKKPQEETTTTTTTTLSTEEVTTVDPYYNKETNVDTEHDAYMNKMSDLKADHTSKLSEVLKQWDQDRLNSPIASTKELKDMEQNLQGTIEQLQVKHNNDISSLTKFHINRMKNFLEPARNESLENFYGQLTASKPKARHVLEALKKYFDVERKEHTHTLQHYYMAVHDDINSEDISTYKDMLLAVEKRINSTVDALNLNPRLHARISEEVAELLSSIPPVLFGDEDEDDDSADEDDSQLIDIFENLPDTHGEKIDDGGLMPMDDNKLDIIPFSPGEADFDYAYSTTEAPADSFDVDDNSIESTLIEDDMINDDGDEGKEDESVLDNDVDGRFNYNGDVKDEFSDVFLNDPQALYVKDLDDPKNDHNVSAGKISWLMWVGVATATIFIIVIVIALVARRNASPPRPPQRVVVDKEEEKEMTPEEKQLLQLQQNGYENPTYKFFEKQMA